MNSKGPIGQDEGEGVPDARQRLLAWLNAPRTAKARLLVFLLATMSCVLAVAPYHEFSWHVHADEKGKIEQIRDDTRNHHHPLLNLAIVDAAVTVFGVDRDDPHAVAVAGRRVSIALMGIAGGLIVLCAFELAALPAAAATWLLLVFHPRMFRFAHFFKEDPAMLVGVGLITWLLIRWFRDGRGWSQRRRWLWMIALGVSLAIAGTSKWVGYFWMPWALLAVAALCPKDLCLPFRKRLGFAAVIALTALLVSGGVQWRAFVEKEQLQKSFASEVERLGDTEYSKNQESVPHGAYFDAMKGKPARVTLVLGLVYFLALLLNRMPWRRSSAELCVVVPILAYLLALSFIAKTADRYLLPGYAFFCLFAALGVVCLWYWASGLKRSGVRLAALVLATALLVFSSYRMFRAYQWEIDGVTSFELQEALADWLRDELPVDARLLYSDRVALVDPTYPEQFSRDVTETEIADLPFSVSYVAEWESYDDIDGLRAAGFTHAVLGADEWRKGKAQAALADPKSQRSRFWVSFFGDAEKLHEVKKQKEWGSHFQHKAYIYSLGTGD